MSAQPTPSGQKGSGVAGEASKDALQKPAATLDEDDEFEDFPVEDWTPKETEVPGNTGAGGSGGEGNTHLWEESWDDDDTSEDFSAQLK
ncbi:MAG: 26S proteasome complex subunit [Thelocarpon impressellum]|nr:MAG: 26S proteasome complex subunit [Thelocarpon impressellum]